MPLYLLDDADAESFPPTRLAQQSPNGLLAIGGDLSPRRLLAAYSQGIFPWYSEGEPLLWWAPNPRCVLRPEAVHVSRRWRRWLRHSSLTITADRSYDAVIEACAAPRNDGGGTWIIPQMIAAYRQLHRLGYAHSVEVWSGEVLVGGLYGVSLGGAFFAESMFSSEENGSKVALLGLCRQLQSWGFGLIDVQMESAHLLSMGAQNWSRDRFEQHLASCFTRESIRGAWSDLWDFGRSADLVKEPNAVGVTGA